MAATTWVSAFVLFFTFMQMCDLQTIVRNGTYGQIENIYVNGSAEYIYWFHSLRSMNPSRVIVWVEYGISVNYPVMIVVTQEQQVTSWELPLIVNSQERNYKYYNTARTLCFSSLDFLQTFYRSPVKSFMDTNKRFSVTITTFAPRPLNVFFKVVEFKDYNVINNVNVTVHVAPSQPSFYYYSFLKNNVTDDNIFIDINSFDDPCIMVSIQRSMCPVRDMNNDITYEGNYLTMNRIGSLYTTKSEFPQGFFLVFVVAPDNYECTAKSSILPTINHKSVNKQQMQQSTVYFKISTGISKNDILTATLGVAGVYLAFLLFFLLLTLGIYLYKNWKRTDEIDDASNDSPLDPIELVRKQEKELTLLMFDTKKSNDRKASNYCYHIANIGIFYGLPVIQLMISYQRAVKLSGNQDICYHNFKCAHQVWGINDFNHIYSNIGYIMMGILFMGLVTSKKYTTKCSSDHGIPKYYGMFYAMGIGLILEGFLSACYHICPTQMNFQFDTSLMYTMAILIMVKLYQNRHPDLNASAYAAFTVLGVSVFLAMIGIMTNSPVVLVLFLIFYCSLCISLSFKIYFFNYVLQTFKEIYKEMQNSGQYFKSLKPIKPGLFAALLLANIFNYTIAGVGVYLYPQVIDFGTYLLILLMANSIVHMCFYVGMKFYYKETLCVEAIIYGILALCFWLPSSYFFFDASTLWAVSPAESRQLNTGCVLLKFYDGHDVWHMLSAFALFFSFMLLLTIDDNLNDTHKKEINVF